MYQDTPVSRYCRIYGDFGTGVSRNNLVFCSDEMEIILKRILLISLSIFILLAIISPIASAQIPIPAGTLDKLQDTFSLLRDDLWVQNDVFWHRGEYDRCIATCKLITKIDPHEVEAYDDAAWLMQNDFRDDEAEAFLLDGLKNNLDRYDMYFCVGYFYYMHERSDKAINALESASSFESPGFVRHILAHAYEQAGCEEDAFNIWLQAEALDPDDQVPRNQIERMMKGGPTSNMPHIITQMRKERKKEEMNSN